MIEKFGTRDVFLMAEKVGVPIVYQNWHPVTFGEYDKKTRTIRVNLRALRENKISKELIVAHELGHFFAAEYDYDRKTEESFAEEFAAKLIEQN